MLLLKKESGELFYNSVRLGRLNVSEANILICLYEYKDTLISRDTLLEIGWPKRVVTPNSLSMAIKNIRSCLEKANLDDVVVTHIKKGFSWNASYFLEVVDVSPQHLHAQKSILHTESTATHIEPPAISYVHEIDSQIKEESNIKPSIKDGFQQSTERGHVKNNISIAFMVFLIMISMAIVMFYDIYWTRVSCYSVNDAKLCGVGPFKVDLIPSVLEQGDYWFGYRLSDGGFYYVKD